LSGSRSKSNRSQIWCCAVEAVKVGSARDTGTILETGQPFGLGNAGCDIAVCVASIASCSYSIGATAVMEGTDDSAFQGDVGSNADVLEVGAIEGEKWNELIGWISACTSFVIHICGLCVYVVELLMLLWCGWCGWCFNHFNENGKHSK